MQTNKIIKSRYFNSNFEAKLWASDLDGRTVDMITHESLEDIILNQIPKEVGVRYDKQVVQVGREHAIVLCTISDASGRRVQSIGEAVTETLYSDIARNYPVTIAENRAFDKAAIRYLAIESANGKVFSKEELCPANTKPIAVQTEQSKAAPEPTPAKEEPSEVIKTEEVTPPLEEELPIEPASEENPIGETIITIGRYKENPVKLKDILNEKDGKRWMAFITGEKFKASTPEQEEQVNAIRSFMS